MERTHWDHLAGVLRPTAWGWTGSAAGLPHEVVLDGGCWRACAG